MVIKPLLRVTLLFLSLFVTVVHGSESLPIAINDDCLINENLIKNPTSTWLGGTSYEFSSIDFKENYTITLLVPSENEMTHNLPHHSQEALTKLVNSYAYNLVATLEGGEIEYLKKPSVTEHELVVVAKFSSSKVFYGLTAAFRGNYFALLRVSFIVNDIEEKPSMKDDINEALDKIKSCLI